MKTRNTHYRIVLCTELSSEYEWKKPEGWEYDRTQYITRKQAEKACAKALDKCITADFGQILKCWEYQDNSGKWIRNFKPVADIMPATTRSYYSVK